MALRFVIIFVIMFVIFFVSQLQAVQFVDGWLWVYAPFISLVEPIVRMHYGRSDGFRTLTLGVWVGNFMYSAVFALVGAFLTSGGLSKSSPPGPMRAYAKDNE